MEAVEALMPPGADAVEHQLAEDLTGVEAVEVDALAGGWYQDADGMWHEHEPIAMEELQALAEPESSISQLEEISFSGAVGMMEDSHSRKSSSNPLKEEVKEETFGSLEGTSSNPLKEASNPLKEDSGFSLKELSADSLVKEETSSLEETSMSGLDAGPGLDVMGSNEVIEAMQEAIGN